MHDCLISIANQTIDFADVELLIVLNGPYLPYYDYVIGELNQLPQKLFKRFLYTKDAGVSNARNVGLNYAQGEYVLFVDDDDVLSLNYIQEMLKVADGKSIVVSNVYSFNLNIEERFMDYLTFKDDTTGILRNRCYLSNACSKLIPVSTIKDRRFDEKFSKGEDSLFMFAISDEIKQIQKATPDCIYYRRIRTSSASRKKTSIQNKLLTIMKQQIAFSYIYIKNPFKYNVLLYLSRILAVFKTLFI